jgi:hypothetical protein
MPEPMPAGLENLIADAHHQLNREIRRKEEVGAETYGEFAFLQNPTLEMAMDEIVDLMNYLRYTYVKTYMLNKVLQQYNELTKPEDVTGFIPTSKLFGGGSAL